MDGLVNKICGGCSKELPLDMFHNSTRDGPRKKCKPCRRLEALRDRDLYGEKRREADRAKIASGLKIRIPHKKGSNKYIAQGRSRYAIRSGKIKRLPCEVCGSEKSHGHHDDYLKPFELRFLCARHHRLWHLENGEGKNA